MSILYILNFTYYSINGSIFRFNDLQTALLEIDKMSFSVFLTFKDSILPAIIWVTLIAGILYFIRKKVIEKYNLYFSNLFILVLMIISLSSSFFICYKTAGYSNKFSTPITTINNVLYYFSTKPYYGERNILNSKPMYNSSIKNIIFILDESISGNYLSINGYQKNSTPYLKSIKNKFINYGLISSAANGSASSNMILMSGLQLTNLPDKNYMALKNPSIFQYAKNANYFTSYISGQLSGYQNYMTKFDSQYIDNWFKPKVGMFDIQNIPEEDIIEEISKSIIENKKNFMFVVKRGVHFHYEKSYPKDKKCFKPTLSKDESITLARKEKVINSYLNGIHWRVDDFFKHLIIKLNLFDRNDTIIIYTSDHGQSILENNITATHNVVINPNLNQGVVPLFVFSPDNTLFDKEKILKNHYSHFQLFPTIVTLMGYDTNCSTLFDKNNTIEQSFFSGDLFGRANTTKTNIGNFIKNITYKEYKKLKEIIDENSSF
jgi:glucan phosphoethanolaminetransferase (alkaline phosphatase superfamily)